MLTNIVVVSSNQALNTQGCGAQLFPEASTNIHESYEKLPRLKPACFSGQSHSCLGVIPCRGTSLWQLGLALGSLGSAPPWGSLPCPSVAQHGTVQQHQGSWNTTMLLPRAVSTERQARASGGGAAVLSAWVCSSWENTEPEVAIGSWAISTGGTA